MMTCRLPLGSPIWVIWNLRYATTSEPFPFLKKVYWGTDGIWSDGYFVSTIGVNEDVIERYIENQGKEDSGQEQLVLDL